ncbi:hypothetical protein SLS60_007127 [Paraconiothyrium brasiliense]|uniref:Uncharacterized protein n=1 Tax=Paraconiothyrium brasiliense TaxID=300254 RepID=A0ABR3R8H6_9PLEO
MYRTFPYSSTNTPNPTLNAIRYRSLPRRSAMDLSAPLYRGTNWPQLPTEIRVEILSYLVIDKECIFRRTHEGMMKEILGTLIEAGNRDLATLALETYYKRNQFFVECKSQYVTYPNPRWSPIIRDLVVEAENFSHEPKDCSASLDIEYPGFFRNSRQARIGDLTQWQSGFTNLRKLRLNFEFVEPYSYNSTSDAYDLTPANMVTDLATDQLTVGVDAISCCPIFWRGEVCACEGKLQGFLESLIKLKK